MDFAKLKHFLRQQIEAWRAFADLTGLPWAQDSAARIEALFDGLFGPAVFSATVAAVRSENGCPVESAVRADASIPAWLLPLLIQLGQELLRRWLTK